jgi:hypothetical protein
VTWRQPDWWQFVVLVLGLFRVVRLVGWDDISATPRALVTGLTDKEYDFWAKLVWNQQQKDRDPWVDGVPGDADDDRFLLRPGVLRVPVGRFRFKLAQLVRCPWCAGFWVCTAGAAAWWAAPDATLAVATPLALSSVVGLVAKHLDQ